MFKKTLLMIIALMAVVYGTNTTLASNSLADTSWNLTTYNQISASGTLSFTNDMMYSKFCNNVSQWYSQINNTIKSKWNAISTMMYCEWLPMTLENNFNISTGGTSTLISGKNLIITTQNSNVFTFIKQESDATVCTMQYAPVCGEVQVQCIKAPCPPIKQTFGNSCMAWASNAQNIVEWTCEDIDMTPEQQSVQRAYQKGITKYNTMDTFMPNSYVTREQAAKMLITTIDKSGIPEWMIKQPEGTCIWNDTNSIDTTLYDQVFRSCAKWLFKGSNEGSFLPHQAITREHMVFLIQRLETFVPKLKQHPYIAQENNIIPYTRLEFVQVLQQISQVLEKAALQDFTQHTKDLETAKTLWTSKNITNYKMEQKSSCFCMEDYTRPMIYDIKDGKSWPATARYNDKDKEQVPQTLQIQFNSVDDAFKIIEDAIAKNVDNLTVTYDNTYGYPVSIAIDYNFMIADEEQYLTFKVIR